MPRPADRRAQATAEWAVVLLAVGAVLAGTALWTSTDRPRRLARALEHSPTDADRAQRAVADAIAARPGALSTLGAQAWLEETQGRDRARATLTAAVADGMRTEHSAWGNEVRLLGPPIRGRRELSIVRSTGPVESRVVTFADERVRTAPPTLDDRAAASAVTFGWQGASTIAQRLARPLGLAVSAIKLAVSLATGDTALPPGARAGDVVVCRRASVSTRSGVALRATSRVAWRIGVLRDGRLILDGVASDNPCAAPADA
jgi:hypothetical protein